MFKTWGGQGRGGLGPVTQRVPCRGRTLIKCSFSAPPLNVAAVAVWGLGGYTPPTQQHQFRPWGGIPPLSAVHMPGYFEQIRTYFGPKLVVSKSGSTTKFSDFAPSFLRPFRTIFGADLDIFWIQVGREQVRLHNKIFRFCTLFFETVPDHIRNRFGHILDPSWS